MQSDLVVAHLTSAHPRYDTRIFLKECRSTAAFGYIAVLVVADGKGEEVRENVSIYDVGASKSRIDRILNAPRRVLAKALELDADIYHLHDPELLPIGLQLKKNKKVVIFDAHEDLPTQLLSKPYLNGFFRWGLSKASSAYERRVVPKLNAVIGATPAISRKFRAMGAVSPNVNNFPLQGELSVQEVNWAHKKEQVAYVGHISEIRGILQLVSAMQCVRSGARLQLAGQFGSHNLEMLALKMQGWDRVDPRGFVSREGIKTILKDCVGGIVTFLPSPNHITAQPNKMFEYMSAGVPVIGSRFPLWQEIIEGNQCGICVDPTEPTEIADAIDYLISHPEEAERMGRNGQQAVLKWYNWNNEKQKLLALYKLLGQQGAI